MNTAVQITPEQEINITRSRFYYLLALGFSFPDEQLRSCRSELQGMADTLYPDHRMMMLNLRRNILMSLMASNRNNTASPMKVSGWKRIASNVNGK